MAKNDSRFKTSPPPGAADEDEVLWLRDQNVLLRGALDSIADAVFAAEPDGVVTYMNPAAQKMFGIERDAARTAGMNLFEFFLLSPKGIDGKIIIEMLSQAPIQQQRAMISPPKGRVVIVEFSASFVEVEGSPRRILCTCHDITVEVEQRKQLEIQALTDDLTGCRNRRWFNERLALVTKKAATTGRNVGLIFLDLDHFKTYNDAAGHLMGDKLIQLVAKTMRDVLSQDYALVRAGGDEFVVVAENVGPDEMKGLAEDLLSAVIAIVMPLPDGSMYRVSASLGVSVLTGDSPNLTNLLVFAENAKRLAKKQGRGQVCIIQPTAE
ncbi:diguanylate cyclase [Patescibacteria group bacterium]|nr:diguanylate cyclase [Patescibacteria group bacterium]